MPRSAVDDRGYQTRIANLRNGTGSNDRLNGSIFLQPTVTVVSDGGIDTLRGGGSLDWFFLLDFDELPDRKKGEALN